MAERPAAFPHPEAGRRAGPGPKAARDNGQAVSGSPRKVVLCVIMFRADCSMVAITTCGPADMPWGQTIDPAPTRREQAGPDLEGCASIVGVAAIAWILPSVSALAD